MALTEQQARARMRLGPEHSRAREFELVMQELQNQPVAGVFTVDGFYMECSRRGSAPYGLGYTLYEEALTNGIAWSYEGGRT